MAIILISKANENHRRPRRRARGWCPDASLPEGHIAFTFDDGPDERATPNIRAQLAACGVCGHFFIPGTRVAGPKARWAIAELKGLIAEGHVIGTHSATHPSCTRDLTTPRSRRRELDRGREALEATLDIRPELFRLPYGEGHWDSEVLFEISSAGLVNLHWNITSDDAKDKQIGSSIEFAGQTERVLWHEGAPIRPSGVLGRLRWRRAGVREGAVSAVRGNF